MKIKALCDISVSRDNIIIKIPRNLLKEDQPKKKKQSKVYYHGVYYRFEPLKGRKWTLPESDFKSEEDAVKYGIENNATVYKIEFAKNHIVESRTIGPKLNT